VTLGDRVQEYAGTITNTEALSSYLSAGLRSIVDFIPMDKLQQHLKQVEFSPSTGVSVGEFKILGVSRNNYNARFLPLQLLAQATDSSSLYYSGTEDPVYYFKNDRIFGSPTSGTWRLNTIPYQDVDFGWTRIQNFPVEYEHLVVLYAALQALISKMDDERSNLPTAPSAPTLSFTPISGNQIATNAAFSIDLTADFGDTSTANTLLYYLSNEEDIELASAKINEIQLKLQEWGKEADLEMQRVMFNAKEADDIDQFNAVQAIQVQIQQFSASLNLYTSAVGAALQKMQYLTGQMAAVRGLYDQALQLMLKGAA
jgi:hypothetical protein